MPQDRRPEPNWRLLVIVLGTALLVFFAVGVATESFGFGATGLSRSAGIVAWIAGDDWP